MRACPHDRRPFRLCEHLLFRGEGEDPYFQLRFAGSDVVPLCTPCADGPEPALAESCDACRLPWLRADTFGNFDGFGGTQPQPRSRDAGLTLVAETADIREALRERPVALAPIPGGARPGWLVLTESWRLVTLALPSCEILAELPPIPAERLPRPVVQEGRREPEPRLQVSADGRYAPVLIERVRHGAIVDLATGSVLLALDRLDYHPEVSGWPFAFFERNGRTLAAHAIDWNRLAVTDLASGERIAAEAEERGENYFLGPLTISPGAKHLATSGWVWQPVGMLRTQRLDLFCEGRLEESPFTYLNQTGYHWNGETLWLDDSRILVWGIGDDDQRMVDAALIQDVERGEVVAWWPGLPNGRLAHDAANGQVWCCGAAETSLWDSRTGERIAHAPVRTHAFHLSLRHAAGVLDDGRISLAFLQRA